MNPLKKQADVEVAIIGGGLAGLLSAIVLRQRGHEVALFEKKNYPFHRVCGEYISLEVEPLLEHLGLFPHHLNPSRISRLEVSSSMGANLRRPLDLGGFGISRYALDHFWAQKAESLGVKLLTNTTVEDYHLSGNVFELTYSGQQKLRANMVIAAYGKRSKLDLLKKRPFTSQRSPYVGVKYHIRMPFPDDLIALHNFPGGYCGLSAIEGGRLNLCYLAGREGLKKAGSIAAFEQEYLHQNKALKRIWSEAEFLFEKPEVINEISFAPRSPVEDHALMVGDTAGLITPLCGNGMALAIHSAWLAAAMTTKFLNKSLDREGLEKAYATAWRQQFAKRLTIGRHLQKLFGERYTTELAVRLVAAIPPLSSKLISLTHGKAIDPCASI